MRMHIETRPIRSICCSYNMNTNFIDNQYTDTVTGSHASVQNVDRTEARFLHLFSWKAYKRVPHHAPVYVRDFFVHSPALQNAKRTGKKNGPLFRIAYK